MSGPGTCPPWQSSPGRPRRWSSACCGRKKSTNSGSSACSVTTAVPGLRYWPRSTARMPRCPANGARNVFLSTHRLLLVGLRARVLQIEVVGVDHRLADGLRLQLPQIAVVVDLRQRRGRLQAPAASPCRHRHAAAAAPGPACTSSPDLKSIWSTTPRDFQRQLGAVHRAQAADRLHLRLPVLRRAVTVETVCGGLAIEASN